MAGEVLYRAYTPDLEVLPRARGGDGRTVVGIAVPYGVSQRIDATLVERFARGAFAAQLRASARVMFARDHQAHGGSIIGRAAVLRDDAAGLYGEFRVSATATGDETLELIRDGVLDELSIGFREGQNRRLPDGTVERVTAHLTEVAVVAEGAYGRGALVSGLRTGSADAARSRLAEAQAILAELPALLL